ncbi:MAG TPA: hypothetical protein VK668_24285 [Mucilaginibacter sp.]|nr:hypothetical protein [Mucilaginibacter sp.]
MLGIITIAQGEKRYIDMAKMLALSLIQVNPGVQRAVVSDADEDEFRGLYDVFIPYDKSFGAGLNQKLHLDKYSPFDETLFVDSDCLAFKSIDTMIELCRKHSFVVFGDQISTGEWYMDVAEMCKKFSLPSIPLFNGGTYYFKNDAVATGIFNRARELKDDYLELGFKPFRGSINEEPLIAVAMALNQVEAVDDRGFGMRTPIGMKGSLNVDVLNERCSFNKDGEIAEPAIMHFAGDFAYYFHYKRECAKLKALHKFPFIGKKLMSFLVNLGYNLSYGTYVFMKRISKMILRREKFDFSISLPVFPNQ